jgi:hypothetical protein
MCSFRNATKLLYSIIISSFFNISQVKLEFQVSFGEANHCSLLYVKGFSFDMQRLRVILCPSYFAGKDGIFFFFFLFVVHAGYFIVLLDSIFMVRHSKLKNWFFRSCLQHFLHLFLFLPFS